LISKPERAVLGGVEPELKKSNRLTGGSKIALASFQVFDQFLSSTAYVELCKKLAENGNHVDFFGIRSRRYLSRNSENMHMIAIPLRAFPLITHMCYLALLALILPFYIAIERPDFIILEPKFGCLAFALESRLFPRQVRPTIVLDIRSTPVEVHSVRALLGALAFDTSVSIASKLCDGITLPTRQMEEEVRHKFRLSTEMTRIWHNGVDTALFRPGTLDDDELRRKFGLEGKFIAIYHGAFRPHGGIVETIKSIQILKKSHPDIMLFLLGGGPGLKLFENLIRECKVEDKVVVHKPVDYSDVPKYIAMADVGIVPLPNIPDWKNQSPLKLIEYLAMAKTVIATDIPANRGVIGDDKCMIYLSSTNPEEIAKALSYASDNRERLREWGTSGRDVIEPTYGWDRIAQQFEKYLNEFAKS
jgi:glycosyltransferase involved in cell wall biosynthesis